MSDEGSRHDEAVVLLHGLAANRLMLRPLANHFRDRGFHTTNWGYPSIRRGVAANAQELSHLLEQLDAFPHVRRLHIVGHSMGAIVARKALTLSAPRKLGRVVLLAPPNAGSPVARRLSRHLGVLCPALRELSDAPGSFVNSLPQPDGVELGVVAALNDRVVPLENTRLVAQTDHVVAPYGHSSMLFQRMVAETIECFLRSGVFCQPCMTLLTR